MIKTKEIKTFKELYKIVEDFISEKDDKNWKFFHEKTQMALWQKFPQIDIYYKDSVDIKILHQIGVQTYSIWKLYNKTRRLIKKEFGVKGLTDHEADLLRADMNIIADTIDLIVNKYDVKVGRTQQTLTWFECLQHLYYTYYYT